MKVQKRSKQGEQGILVDFNPLAIIHAIEGAMRETLLGVDSDLSKSVAESVEAMCGDGGKPVVTVEEIQDMVENLLMKSTRPEVAKKYILYRDTKLKNKQDAKTEGLLTDRFISSYKHLPSPMKQLGSIVYYRTYSRFLPAEKRREYWWETVRRAVEYNCSLVKTSRAEAEELYDNIFNLRQFLSGRTLWVGDTIVSKNYPMSNYNCAFEVIDNFEAFEELFYLSMLGCGVGLRVLKSDVEKLPKIRTDVEVIHKDYIQAPKASREDHTSLHFSNDMVRIVVGDSKEGWMQALRYFFQIAYKSEYRNINFVLVDYDFVRPSGEKLKQFGGTASGHASLEKMFLKIDEVLKRAGSATGKNRVALRPIDCLDIANIIGENVVSGGVRRTAEIVLIDGDSEECVDAKTHLYKEENGKWHIDPSISHRQMSNNSIFYNEKPSRERLHWQFGKMRYSGEPAWINGEAIQKRNKDRKGVNPCGEILLDDKGMCNLTTINVFSFVQAGALNEAALLKAQRLSVRAGYRMTCVEMELPKWDATLQRDKLVGCSLTGWQDMVNATNMSKEEQVVLLQKLRETAHQEGSSYAKDLGQNAPLLYTTVKPEGSLSQLPTVSSGVHFSHSPYYIRRIRISPADPIVKVCEELDYPVLSDHDGTKVVEFPVKAPQGRTKYDVSALEQLEIYTMFMDHYVDHNCSITVHVRDHEWEQVEQWVWDHWDEQIGITFLSLDESFYNLMPYEAITKEEYEKRADAMKPFIPSLISKYEAWEEEYEVDSDCATGLCPVR